MFYIMLFRKHMFTQTCVGYVCHAGTRETILFSNREQAQLSANAFEKDGIVAEVRMLWP